MSRRAVSLLASAAVMAGAAGAVDAPPGPVADRAPFALTVDELRAWRPGGPTDDAGNAARVPLAARFVTAPVGVAARDPAVRVLYAPDGMDRLANYPAPQPRFNLYGFTHWPQIDLLAWFAGTAGRSVNLPAARWVDAAHRNGVKVIGTVFFAPTAWGGRPDTVSRFLARGTDGHFPAAAQLVAMARRYGFDGWLVNAETDLPRGSADAATMIDFMAELTRLAAPDLEIHWYDAILPDGRVVWQNALTRANLPFLQDGTRRTADAMFLNYAWTPQGLRESAALAERAGRSRYDLFVGADLWPGREGAQAAFRNARWIDALRDPASGRALGSIALFAPHFAYSFAGDRRAPRFSRFERDPRDVARFHDAERRLFAGDTRNLATVAARGWPGVGAIAPVHGIAVRLPFRTSFNVGHGLVDARAGRATGGAWHDMRRQDVLPTWQFAATGARRIAIGFDFAAPFEGGAALRLAPRGTGAATVPLYALRVTPAGRVTVSATVRTGAPGYALRTAAGGADPVELALPAGAGWRTVRRCVPGAGAKLDLAVVVGTDARGPLHLGALGIEPGCASVDTGREKDG